MQSRMYFLASLQTRSLLDKKSLTITFLLSSNNNSTNFHLHLQLFGHDTLNMAGHRAQPIVNISTVAGSVDAVADA